MSSRSGMRFLYCNVPMTITDWLVDCVIAAGAFGIAMLQLSLSINLFVPDAFTRMLLGITNVAPSASAIAVTFAMSSLLVFRRKFAWPVFALTLLIWVLADRLLGLSSLPIVSVLVALFTICYEIGSIDAGISATISVLVMVGAYSISSSTSYASLTLFQNVSMSIAVALAGYALSVRNDYIREADQRAKEAELLRISEAKRAREAEATRESEAARRVDEERVRIARELHDIIGHSLSAVSIQAAAAERLMDNDPQSAKQSVEEIRRISKESLADIRSMVSVLRGDNEEADKTPTSGTDQMGELLDYLEKAGISSDLKMADYAREKVPSHIDIALFGIAREACTNIVRHSHASHATISLKTIEPEDERESAHEAILIVSDDGTGLQDSIAEGHGIAGMRERAALLKGTFDIRESTTSGMLIEVKVPFEPLR